MKIVKIEVTNKDITIHCPHCDNWEAIGIDDARKRLDSFPILSWLPDEENINEKSNHKCDEGENEFQVEWDYETEAREREKELSLLCCVIRENEIINSSLFQSFDKIFEIANAFLEKYGVDDIKWGPEMDYEETVFKFATHYITKTV